MIRKIGEKLLFIVVALLSVVAGVMVSDHFYTPPPIWTLPAKVEEIRQAVELSTLDIAMDEIFKDSINNKGVVFRVKSRVYINFDMGKIHAFEQGDTLIVLLPLETVNIYESTDDGYQVLDVWTTWFPETFAETPLSTAEENVLKGRLKQRIKDRMYEKGYVEKARKNAVTSLSLLFSKFKDHIIIVDPCPEGWKELEIKLEQLK